MPIDKKLEYDPREITRDTRPLGSKIASFLREPQNALMAVGTSAICSFLLPAATEFFFLVGAGTALWSHRIQKYSGLPQRIPKSANVLDPKEIDLKTEKPVKGEGIIYLGNEMGTREEVWLSDTQARTHMVFLGTTGSGKALSNRSKVLTPSGWKLMGDVQVGDILSIPGHKTTYVKGVYPQGRKRMYVLSLAPHNGERKQVECCDEHLWLARINGDERVARTDEIIEEHKNGADILLPVSDVEAAGDGLVASETTWVKLRSVKKGTMQAATCILVESAEHLFITDGGIVTHNTEFLISLVYNALIHGSGFIYVDGKADSSLYGKIYSMARSLGREDSVLVINFQTGAKDIFGAQPFKMSHTVNPFAVGSSGMLTQLVVSLMSTGKGDVWEGRAISFVEAIMKPLVFLRDNYGLMLDVEMIREYFELKRLEELAWRDADRYPGLEMTLGGLHSYLLNLPTYDKSKFQAQGETCIEQHGYISMQLVRTFNSLADTYGYIMKTPLAEVDFLDVFLNRRILVVLLPALEKSMPELTNLGRIIVASIKATMAVGLGARIEGDWAKIIDSKPTTSPSPYMCVLDEYGYYAVEGFSVVPAQARSLGFSAIFAGQDLPAFQKASEKEAESTLANTNTKLCGKLECTKTYKYFSDLASQGFFTRASGFQGSTGMAGATYMDNNNASIERFDRVTFNDLRGQKSGQWHLFFANDIVRIKSFFAAPKAVKTLRVNHFITVARPSAEEVEAYRRASEGFAAAIESGGGLNNFLDTIPSREFVLLNDGFEAIDGATPLFEAAIGSVLHYASAEKAKFDAFERILRGVPNGVGTQEDGSESFDASTEDEIPVTVSAPRAGTMPPLHSPEPKVEHSDNATQDSEPTEVYIDFMHKLGTIGQDRNTPEDSFGEGTASALPASESDGHIDEEDAFADCAPPPVVDLPDELNEEVALALAAGDSSAATDTQKDVVAEDTADQDDWVAADGFDVIDEKGATKDKIFIASDDEIDFFEEATVFGAIVPSDVEEQQEANHGSGDDVPVDGLSFGEALKRKRKPKKRAVEGLLDRDETLANLKRMEQALGAGELEAEQSASAITTKIAEVTKYPITPPNGPVTTEQFKEIARNFSKILEVYADQVQQEGDQ